MRRLLFTLMLSLLPIAAQAEGLRCRVVATEPGALMRFVETMAGRPHLNEEFARQFRELHPMSADDEEVLKRVADMEWDQRWKPLAAECETADEFLRRAEGLAPQAKEFATLKEAMEHFQPLYEDTVWKPCLTVLEQQKQEFDRAIREKLGPALQKVARFYDATLPDGECIVELVPIPSLDPHHTSTCAESIDTLQIVEVLDKHTYWDTDSVVMHEFVHTAFHHRSPAVVAMMQETALHNNAVDALHQMNEALACAFGQGWFRERVSREPADGQWYNDVSIQTFGRALFPMATAYAEAGKTIDPAFMRDAIALFREQVNKYPDAPRFAFAEMLVFGSHEAMPVTREIQKEVVSAHSIGGAVLGNKEAVEIYRADPTVTAIFMMQKSELHQLKQFGITPPVNTQPRELIVQHIHNRLVVISVAPTVAEQQNLLMRYLHHR